MLDRLFQTAIRRYILSTRCYGDWSPSKGVRVLGEIKPGYEAVLTNESLAFLASLHRTFDARRQELLHARKTRQEDVNDGKPLQFPRADHDSAWKVASVPRDLQRRHVEITGPTDRKMVINALNSGADVFMADFEDSLSPTWSNVVEGQINLKAANERNIEFKNPDGSLRTLKDVTAQLLVRTRGWHLNESHVIVDGGHLSGALFDFGLYYLHNVTTRMRNGTGAYFYLPKMEHHLECRLWNDVFAFAEDYLGLKNKDTIRATVMVETLPAAFEMEEMLFELRKYACAMNAGRWDYIFSLIKVLNRRPDCVLPDRKQIVMTTPFLAAYTERLVRVCHSHGAHAMGGMSAFIPSRRDEEVNRMAIQQVTGDKEREVTEGFDGTWVAHPDLVKVAKEIFVNNLNDKDHQVEKIPGDIVRESSLTSLHVEGGEISEAGVRTNIKVALQYINQWLQGHGAVALNNLMEDAATAEISRAQLWQWLHHDTTMTDGRILSDQVFRNMLQEELDELGGRVKEAYGDASDIVGHLVTDSTFETFLTLPAYKYLVNTDTVNE